MKDKIRLSDYKEPPESIEKYNALYHAKHLLYNFSNNRFYCDYSGIFCKKNICEFIISKGVCLLYNKNLVYNKIKHILSKYNIKNKFKYILEKVK